MSRRHPSKRQYNGSQPSITSYFPPATTSPPSYDIIPQPSHDSSTPILPADIQSGLVNVGMRIRKSVPEGYKTGEKYSAFKLFCDPASPPLLPSATPIMPYTRSRSNPEFGEQKRTVSGGRPRARELEPFCGINKVGGLLDPPHWNAQYGGRRDEDLETDEDVPFLSSQGSTISDVSVQSVVGTVGNKRTWEEEDNNTFILPEKMGFGQRPMAIPRRMKNKEKISVEILGQENTDMDFGEAEFLDYELVGEIEMGGV